MNKEERDKILNQFRITEEMKKMDAIHCGCLRYAEGLIERVLEDILDKPDEPMEKSKKCEPNCYEKAVRYGRADWRCAECGRQLMLELVLIRDAEEFTQQTKGCCEKCWVSSCCDDKNPHCENISCSCHASKEKCKNCGRKTTNGDYCSNSHCEYTQPADWDTEIFMDFCDLYRNYFKRAEIEGMDMVVGHLASIGKDYVKANLSAQRKEMERYGYWAEKIVENRENAKEQTKQEILSKMPKEKETNGITIYSTPDDGYNMCLEECKDIIKGIY